MKILPSYLIEYMPYLEDAMEELRLSVYDHAFDLLKALDIDELTSDDIRHKLELYDIKIENMSESWLPNGRFYRIYPSIRYNRTRLNALQSVVKSGGQFEGLWSNDFSNKTEFNYKYIQMLRHYMASSPVDGYFYISGDTAIINDGTVSSSAVTALSSDILVDQAMPAGYTYLYVPWPVPHYPTDAGSFYNPHMLLSDRLYYTDGIDGIDVIDENDDSSTLRDISKPASTTYDWSTGSDTPYRLPYWFDYHYMNDMRHVEPNNNDAGKWPIIESGIYSDKNGATVLPPADISKAVTYTLNESCDELGDTESVFPTQCWTILVTNTTPPDRNSVSDITSFNIDYSHLPSEIEVVNNSIDLSYPGADENEYGPYRYDALSSAYFSLSEILGHIKVGASIWTSSTSPIYNIFNMYSVGQDSTLESRKLYYWMRFTSGEQSEDYVSIYEYTDNENPAISIDSESYVLYTKPYNDGQGENSLISVSTGSNALYKLGESSADLLDPTLSYKLVRIGVDDNHSQSFTNIDNCYTEVDPSTGLVYLNVNGSALTSANYITYTSSRIHKLWFSSTKEDTIINSSFSKLYNENGSDEIYYYSSNLKSFNYNIIGLYNSDGTLADYDLTEYSFNCYLTDSKYGVFLRVNPIVETDTIEYDTNSSQWQLASIGDGYPSLGDDADEYTVFKGKVDPTISDTTVATLSFTISPTGSWDGSDQPMPNASAPTSQSYSSGWLSTPAHEYPTIDSTWKVFESTTITHLGCCALEISIGTVNYNTTLNVKISSLSEYNWDFVYIFDYYAGTDHLKGYVSGQPGEWTDVQINLSAGTSHIIKVVYSRDGGGGPEPNCGWFAISKSIYDSNKITEVTVTPHTATLDVGFTIESDNDIDFPIKISHTGNSLLEEVDVYKDGVELATHSSQNLWTDVNNISLSSGSHSVAVKYNKYTSSANDYGFVAIPNSLINIATMSKTFEYSYTPSLPPFSAAYILFTADLVNSPMNSLSYTNIEISSTIIPKIADGMKLGDNPVIKRALRLDLGNFEFHSDE